MAKALWLVGSTLLGCSSDAMQESKKVKLKHGRQSDTLQLSIQPITFDMAVIRISQEKCTAHAEIPGPKGQLQLTRSNLQAE